MITAKKGDTKVTVPKANADFYKSQGYDIELATSEDKASVNPSMGGLPQEPEYVKKLQATLSIEIKARETAESNLETEKKAHEGTKELLKTAESNLETEKKAHEGTKKK